MRSKLTMLAASAVIALTAQAAIDLGNGVKVVPNVITSVDFNDNFFLTPTAEQDETVIRLSPGVSLGLGQGALNTAEFRYNEEFQFYSDESDLNTSISLLDFTSRYDDGKMKIEVDAWWHEANQPTRDIQSVGSLIKRELTHGAISDEVRFTEKTSAKLGIVYDNTDYKRADYSDWQWTEIPVQYFYAIQPKLDLSLGFRYRTNDVDGTGVDSDEYFYNVGVRGEITPKLTGEVAVGYIQLERDLGNSQSTLGVEAKLIFAVSPKTNLGLNASNRYGYSATGDTYRSGGFSATFDTAISAQLAINGAFFYSNYDYIASARSEDYYGGRLGATYTFNEHVDFRGTYSYAKNDSTLAAASFANSIFSLAATLKY